MSVFILSPAQDYSWYFIFPFPQDGIPHLPLCMYLCSFDIYGNDFEDNEFVLKRHILLSKPLDQPLAQKDHTIRTRVYYNIIE